MKKSQPQNPWSRQLRPTMPESARSRHGTGCSGYTYRVIIYKSNSNFINLSLTSESRIKQMVATIWGTQDGGVTRKSPAILFIKNSYACIVPATRWANPHTLSINKIEANFHDQYVLEVESSDFLNAIFWMLFWQMPRQWHIDLISIRSTSARWIWLGQPIASLFVSTALEEFRNGKIVLRIQTVFLSSLIDPGSVGFNIQIKTHDWILPHFILRRRVDYIYALAKSQNAQLRLFCEFILMLLNYCSRSGQQGLTTQCATMTALWHDCLIITPMLQAKHWFSRRKKIDVVAG